MENIITITDSARQQIKTIYEREQLKQVGGSDSTYVQLGLSLRLSVVGGGCSGLSYKIDFGEKKANDYVINLNFIDVVIDPKSCIYLKNTTLDFQDGLNGKGFVFSNPNATNTCGCGESFSI